jgi:hypothetical protein
MARSDDALLAAAGEDAEAFGLFYRRHAAALLAYLAYQGGRRQAAQVARAEGAEAAGAGARGGARRAPGAGRGARGRPARRAAARPVRERGRRTVAVFGFTRADTRALTLLDRRGRRYRAKLSRPRTTAARRAGDLAGVDGGLRERLERLPRRMRVRSWIASLDIPPEPLDAGLGLVVKLKSGKTLRIGV